MSQRDAILQHLKADRLITPLDALRLYGCLRLAARIRDLRDRGYRISTQIVVDGDRRYAAYRLETNA